MSHWGPSPQALSNVNSETDPVQALLIITLGSRKLQTLFSKGPEG